MDNDSISFEQILNATVRMVRISWKVPVCLFLQIDDQNDLRVRAVDGNVAPAWDTMVIKASDGLVGRCIGENTILETGRIVASDGLSTLLNPNLNGNDKKFVLVPVSGQARTLGIIILGPMDKNVEIKSKEAELRSAGTLCAVLSAHWRLYEWMSHFLPQVNHELRTPLTAVQGSIGMVLGGMFGQVGSEVREMLEMAHKGCERTVRAIEGYLNEQEPPKDK